MKEQDPRETIMDTWNQLSPAEQDDALITYLGWDGVDAAARQFLTSDPRVRGGRGSTRPSSDAAWDSNQAGRRRRARGHTICVGVGC